MSISPLPVDAGCSKRPGFRNRFDNLIVAVGKFAQSSRYRTDNIPQRRGARPGTGGTGRQRSAGIDLQARATYTFLDSEILAVDRPIRASPGSRPEQPLLQARVTSGRWT